MAAPLPFTFAYFAAIQQMQITVPNLRWATITMTGHPDSTAPRAGATITLVARLNGGTQTHSLIWGPSQKEGQMLTPVVPGGPGAGNNSITLGTGQWNVEVYYQDPGIAIADHCNQRANGAVNFVTPAFGAIAPVSLTGLRPTAGPDEPPIAHGTVTFG